MTRDTQPDQSEFYTVSETAQYLRLCEKQVRRLISRGELSAFRFGTALRIHKSDIATSLPEDVLSKLCEGTYQ